MLLRVLVIGPEKFAKVSMNPELANPACWYVKMLFLMIDLINFDWLTY